MKSFSNFGRYALSVSVACAFLSGCGGSQSGSQFQGGALPQSVRNVPMGAHRDGRTSWMNPKAKDQVLVYVSNGRDDSVSVYGFYDHKLRGMLYGIDTPYGVCSDGQGNVWIVAYGDYSVVEYAHAGTKRLKTLEADDTDLYDCSVDPTTGDVAVTNWGVDNWFKGNVLVFHRAEGEPTAYTGDGVWFYYGLTYDDSGNLYVDGLDSYRNGNLALGMMPKHGDHLQRVSLQPQINPPLLGGIRWDGHNVAIGNWKSVYGYSVSGHYARLKSETPLTDKWPVGLFWITRFGKHQIVAPDQDGNPSAVQTWDYPRGRLPTATIARGLSKPFGVTVSVKP